MMDFYIEVIFFLKQSSIVIDYQCGIFDCSKQYFQYFNNITLRCGQYLDFSTIPNYGIIPKYGILYTGASNAFLLGNSCCKKAALE